ncbi:MAG TPA: hypothetical protein VLT88_07810 [Desulfosarcina sp.]|nr:hypothetical protein [Desulfosarcina sp.]
MIWSKAFVMQTPARRLDSEGVDGSVEADVCQGTLLSRAQYRTDFERWGFKDARVTLLGSMTPSEILDWENNR